MIPRKHWIRSSPNNSWSNTDHSDLAGMRDFDICIYIHNAAVPHLKDNAVADAKNSKL